MEYSIRIIRSNRKSMGLEIKEPGVLLVRAPIRLSEKQIVGFTKKNEAWIQKHMKIVARKVDDNQDIKKITKDKIEQLAKEALTVIPKVVAKYAMAMDVDYGRITIRNQKTRWGSCSSKGNLNFNCLLMLAPRSVLEYVVIHELAHRKEMNHSVRFWRIVESMKPDYEDDRRWLREEGSRIIEKMING